MQILGILLLAIGAGIVPFYLHALVRFRRILRAERPDLAKRRGSLGFDYPGMPGPTEPRAGAALISAAFGPVVNELSDPNAAKYARRIRLSLLISAPAVFLAFLIMVASAP
jgi:hypothetical protein